jgi:predicted MFS family arabinose efflux permease
VTAAAAALLSFGAAIVVGAEFIVIGLSPAMARDLAISPAQTGLLVTLFALASAVLGPVLVSVMARLRPAIVLASALLPFAASLLLLAIPSFAAAAVVRVLQGAALPVFMSIAGAQLAFARGTGPGVAFLYVGVTVGGTLAPPLGTFAADRFGWEMPMAVIGTLALVAAPACLLLPSHEPTDRGGTGWQLVACVTLRAHLLLSTFLFAAMFTGFSYVALLLGRAGLGADAVTLALLTFGVGGLAGNWLAGRLAHSALTGTSVAAVAVAAATTWLSLAIRPGPAAVGLAMMLWGLAHSAGFVFCQVRVMAAAPRAPGFAGSLNISAANVGIATGSFLGGLAIELFGPTALVPITAALALLSICVAHNIAWRARPCAAHDARGPSALRMPSDGPPE